MTCEAGVLEQSPLDGLSLAPVTQIRSRKRQTRWVGSRYTARATTGDGRLILWNSFSGSMSVFTSDQKPKILRLLARTGYEAKKEGIVAYLADRGFVVEEGTDELRRVQYAFGQDHYRSDRLELILLASEDCNFRCTYCYEEFARGTMRPEVRASVKALVRRRVDALRHLQISWFGGEPLYGLAAIEELAPFFVETVDTHGLTFHSHMTTNGYLLTPDVADRLLAWRITDFQITMDGAPEDHDRSRPGRDGSPTFDVIFDNLVAMHQRDDDFSITLRVNFDQENHPRLMSFMERVEDAFAGDERFQIAFHAVGRWGGPNDEQLAVCGTEEAGDIKARFKAEARRRGLRVGGTLKEVQGPGAQVCYAARPYNFIIGADGQVMKCTIALDMKDYNRVGQLSAEGELKLDEDRMALWTEPAFLNDAKCRKCVIVPTCQGIHCPMIRIEDNKQPCPDTRLKLKKEMLEALAVSESKSRQVQVRSAM